jgi:hypothetical protein
VLETAVPDTPAGRDAPTFQPNIVKGKRRAPALPLRVVVLIGGHMIFFNRLRHAGGVAPCGLGLVLLAIAKHLGVFGSLYSHFR